MWKVKDETFHVNLIRKHLLSRLRTTMRRHKIRIFSVLLLNSFLFLCVFLTSFKVIVNAETNFYWVTVNPTVPVSVIHLPIGQNFCISFRAVWTYGDNSGNAIENATVPVEVKTADDILVQNLVLKTNATGFISFNYSSQKPMILTFTPTKLITEDGVEWNQSLIKGAYGFHSESLTIYWDSFDISLMSVETNSLGTIRVVVRITYFLIPEEGLTIQNNSQRKYIPKQVHGVDVKINGIKAEELSTQGVYAVKTSTILPTTYILVEVSHEEWRQNKAFVFDHTANKVLWVLTVILGFAGAALAFARRLILSAKTKVLFKIEPTAMAAILLASTSFISVYWALVGIECTLHGFNWMMLGIFGIISFAFGIVGSVMSKRKKHFALTMIIACFPLIENIIVMNSFDNYQLPIPWVVITLTFAISTISGILIGRSDKEFI